MCITQKKHTQAPKRGKKELMLNIWNTELYLPALGQVIPLCLSLLILQNEANSHT